MPEITINDLLVQTDDETSAGNYFVANYPPFSFWTEEAKQNVDQLLQNKAKEKTSLGLYFHVPFCRKRCHFCYFRVYTDKNAEEINRYLDAGIQELELYAQSQYIQGRFPQFIYFGGGTPSYLSAKQLISLTDRMKALIPWEKAEEVAFEAEPGTLKEDKLQAIRDCGVTRLSLGIENFDDRILEINGRAHRTKEIFRAYDFAKSLGFPQINIDLIAGMVEETESNWRRCVDQTLELQPDSVTIYQMEVPYNTGIYKQMKAEGKLTAPVANWKTKREWVKFAFAEFEKAGYTITSAYTAVKNPEKTKFVYRDQLWRGADLLALGVASFSHMGGVHFQNKTEFESYLESIKKKELPIHRALQTTEEERMLREFILQMKLGTVHCDYFEKKFGIDLKKRFLSQFKEMEEQGLMKQELVDGKTVLTLSRDTLLRIDTLLHAFFLPKHQQARYT